MEIWFYADCERAMQKAAKVKAVLFSSERKLMRVQVPPSAPQFNPTVLRFLARMTLAVKSPAQ